MKQPTLTTGLKEGVLSRLMHGLGDFVVVPADSNSDTQAAGIDSGWGGVVHGEDDEPGRKAGPAWYGLKPTGSTREDHRTYGTWLAAYKSEHKGLKTHSQCYDAPVRRMAIRMITAIQLTRLTMAFGAISDVWFVILLTQARNEYIYIPVHSMSLPVALLAGATVAVGLFAFGASLNDVLDVRHDTAFSPDRPIPAGRIRYGQAIVVTVGALIVAMLGGVMLSLGAPGAREPSIGATAMTLLTATGILFYNAAGKFIPAVGLIAVGLIHAAHMLIPNYQLQFTLPICLVMTHAMVIAAIVHRLEDKRPRLRVRSLVLTGIGWLVCIAILLSASKLEGEGLWPKEATRFGVVWPVLAVISFIIMARIKTRAIDPKAAAEKLKRYGAMWQALYGAAWLMAWGLPAQATWIGLFALAGFAAMTLIKEITGLSDRPLAFR